MWRKQWRLVFYEEDQDQVEYHRDDQTDPVDSKMRNGALVHRIMYEERRLEFNDFKESTMI